MIGVAKYMVYAWLLLFFGCSSVLKKDHVYTTSLVIKYIDLATIYLYVQKSDAFARELGIKRQKLEDDLARVKTQQFSSVNHPLYKKQLQLNAQLKKISTGEETYKKKLLLQISIAVQRVAKKYKADYVMNIGDEVVYGDKKHDVTEDVIRELNLLNRRSAPITK